MAQFDVYENSNPETREAIPFLIDLQADLLEDLATRVVAPLFSASVMMRPAQHLNPAFVIGGRKVVMSTSELAGVPKSVLGLRVGSLKESRDEIVAALDFLFTWI